MIEEPTGTICSLRNPRTTAGGILIGDNIHQTGRDNFGGHSMAYVVPKGFDGKYRMLVRRVWGNVVTGNVTVEVLTHVNNPIAASQRRKIQLDKDQAMVAFELKAGRRTEPLAQQQVVNSIESQIAVNETAVGQWLKSNPQLLGQQIAASIDPGAMLGYAIAHGYTPGGEGGTGGQGPGDQGIPFFARGAVGYQPQIIWLPAGATLFCQAVVSADRRYVRITASPSFSGITAVNTFNYATGSSGTSDGTNTGSGGSGIM